MGRSNTLKPAVVTKEEAKVDAQNKAAEATARRFKSKKQKSNMTYNIAVGSVIAVCVIAAFAAVSGPAKPGSASALDNYVNDASHIDDVTSKAEGNFTAAASPFFNKWTLADVKWGHSGIHLSGMLNMPGAVQVCEGEEGMEEGGAIPPSYDARANWPGCFGDVHDSGNCSSSYATAAVDAIASRFCIADNDKHNALRLSAQQILSCDKKSKGCKGGGVDNVWAYIQRRGLYPEDCLPFAGEKGAQCKTECKEEQKLKVLDHCVLTRQKSIKREIYNRGPVVAPISIKKDYLVYSNGVYSPTEGASSDFMYDEAGKPVLHAVSVLGWGKSQGTPYWLVRHSWGSNWGENGYARVATDTVLHEGYAVAGTPATASAIAAAEAKKGDDAKKKEEARIERVARDARIAENRKRYEAEQAANAPPQEATEELDDMEDDDFEAEVDLDSDAEAAP